MTKAVPISRRVQGQLPPDLAFSADLRVDPEAAEVRGPESRVAGLDSIPLAPLDLSRIRDSEIVTLAIDTSGLGGASVTPPDAMVGVRVEPRIERTLDNRPVRVNVPEPGIELRVEPASVRVQLSGARSLVTTMDLTLLRVSVPAASLAGMIPGEERRVPIRIDGVPRLVTARSSTDAVTVVRTMAPSGGVPRDPS
jgi:YbbR domain-containing protein